MSRYSLFKEGGKWVIRQWVGNRNVRLPVRRYKAFRDNEEELKAFVARLNAPLTAKEKVAFKHAFINDALLEEYLEWLLAQVPTERNARCEFQYLKEYCLNYFIGALDLMNPVDWHQVSETKWAKFLCSDKAPGSAKAKREIIRSLNRFMGWLHKRRPGEIQPLKFTPISKAKYKQIEAQRELDGEIKERKNISSADWARIRPRLPSDIRPWCLLGLHYGLRRSETLGCTPGMVRRGFLSAERQYAGGGEYRPLKGRDNRQIPHWFANGTRALLWLQEAQTLPLIHPDTLTDKWNVLMDELGLDYDFHDLRHTYITKAIRKHPPHDVMLAAGHKNIETTMRYLHDDRNLDAEPLLPDVA